MIERDTIFIDGRECAVCRAGQESYCRRGKVLTYNAVGRDGQVTLGGYSERVVPLCIDPYALLTNRRKLAGSMSGGMPETQEMLDFCGEHGIGAEVELIAAKQLDEAYDRLAAGDVRYRFVLDTATIADS